MRLCFRIVVIYCYYFIVGCLGFVIYLLWLFVWCLAISLVVWCCWLLVCLRWFDYVDLMVGCNVLYFGCVCWLSGFVRFYVSICLFGVLLSCLLCVGWLRGIIVSFTSLFLFIWWLLSIWVMLFMVICWYLLSCYRCLIYILSVVGFFGSLCCWFVALFSVVFIGVVCNKCLFGNLVLFEVMVGSWLIVLFIDVLFAVRFDL